MRLPGSRAATLNESWIAAGKGEPHPSCFEGALQNDAGATNGRCTLTPSATLVSMVFMTHTGHNSAGTNSPGVGSVTKGLTKSA